MLNNRQQTGRRRGRGGQRQQGTGGRVPEQGNRIDNRARGNAPQMLEKYKTLARDSQLAGDRVMTEYYHQFADHYFRVVAETRARYEEQRRQRDDWQDDDEGEGGDERSASDDRDGEGYDNDAPRDDYRRREPQMRDDRPRDDRPREDRPREDRPREDRPREYQNRDTQNRDTQNRDTQNRDAQPRDAQPREDRQRQPREYRNRDDRGGGEDRAPRRNGRDDRYARNGNARDESEAAPATIDIAVLPPAFGSDAPMINPVADLPMGFEGDRVEAVVAVEPPKRRGRPRKTPPVETSEAG